MKPIQVIECGCCSHYHRVAYTGDCRNDAERFADLQDAADRLGKPVVEAYETEDGKIAIVPFNYLPTLSRREKAATVSA
jgi:hypothetical protein